WVALHTTPASTERYGLSLAYARRHLGDRPFQKIRPENLAALYATLAQSLAPRTVRHVHLVLHKAFAQAAIWGLIRQNPADLAKPPPIRQTEVSILQPDQVRDLLNRLRGHRLFLIAALALATGMRRNEMLALRWRDVDLDGARLTVAQALEQANGIV